MEKPTPISYLIEHKDIILEAYHQNHSSPKAAWKRLQRDLPDLIGAMKFNTFKQYVPVFVALGRDLEKNHREKARVIRKLDKAPKRISGWNVQKSKDGYFRCYRKVRNRVHCIYIGKMFDENKALDRIVEKERQPGLDKG